MSGGYLQYLGTGTFVDKLGVPPVRESLVSTGDRLLEEPERGL